MSSIVGTWSILEGVLCSGNSPQTKRSHTPRDTVSTSIPSHSYLLRPSLQLLPLLQADLPHSSQQVMRGHKDPGAQEECEDVCPLKKGDRQSAGQAWNGSIQVGSCHCSSWPGPSQASITCGASVPSPAWFPSPYIPCFSHTATPIPPTLEEQLAGILQHPLSHSIMGASLG